MPVVSEELPVERAERQIFNQSLRRRVLAQATTRTLMESAEVGIRRT
jgi:hypothetical protein